MARREDCLLVKLHHSLTGLPDRLLVRDRQPDVFVEFKRPGEAPTKIQAHWHRVLRGMGKQVEVVKTVEQFRWLLLTT